MYGADESFVKNFDPGDIIVAGTNFGCGSSREHAAITLKAVGAGAVLAESFGRIFFRNAINLGVPVITCSEITKIIAEGDEVEVDIEAGIIKNLTTGSNSCSCSDVALYYEHSAERRDQTYDQSDAGD